MLLNITFNENIRHDGTEIGLCREYLAKLNICDKD